MTPLAPPSLRQVSKLLTAVQSIRNLFTQCLTELKRKEAEIKQEKSARSRIKFEQRESARECLIQHIRTYVLGKLKLNKFTNI